MAANTPDMTVPARKITDPHLLYERIGYRVWLDWREGRTPKLYRGFNSADLGQLRKLLGPGDDDDGLAGVREPART